MTNLPTNWTEWLKQSRFSYMSEEQKDQTVRWLLEVRNNILNIAELKPGETIIDIGTGTGLLAFGIYELMKNSCKIIASDNFDDCINECSDLANNLGIPESTMEFKKVDASDMDMPDNCVDVAVMRSVLVHILDKQKPISEIYRILKPSGRAVFYEPVISSNTRYNELVNIKELDIFEKVIEAEEFVMNYPEDPMTNFTPESIGKNLQDAGFTDIKIQPVIEESSYPIKDGMIDQWMSAPPRPGGDTMKDRLLKKLSSEDFNKYREFLIASTLGKNVTIKTTSIYCLAIK